MRKHAFNNKMLTHNFYVQSKYFDSQESYQYVRNTI